MRLKRESGISPETLLRKKASSHVERRIFWFYSSCGRKLGVSLELRQGNQEPPCIASGNASLHASCMGLSGFLSSQCWVLGPHLELRPKHQCSPPMLTWISGFLLNFNSGVRPHFMWRHASPLSCLTLSVVSGFMSS